MADKMKRIRRLLACILCVCLICGNIPMPDYVYAEVVSEVESAPENVSASENKKETESEDKKAEPAEDQVQPSVVEEAAAPAADSETGKSSDVQENTANNVIENPDNLIGENDAVVLSLDEADSAEQEYSEPTEVGNVELEATSATQAEAAAAADEDTADTDPEIVEETVAPEVTSEPMEDVLPDDQAASVPEDIPAEGEDMNSIAASEASESPAPETSATPAAEADSDIILPSAEITIHAESDKNHIFSNDGDIRFFGSFDGGVAPYKLTLEVFRGDVSVYNEVTAFEQPADFELAFAPNEFGKYAFAAVLTDSAGSKANADALVYVAEIDRESEDDWAESVKEADISGDWREDIVEIAKTQLGYHESEKDFVIKDDEIRPYTRYGHWFGEMYEEWSAMFVAFCLEYAEISSSQYPRDVSAADLKQKLIRKDAYRDDEAAYIPESGDLVFFSTKNKNTPDRVGIIEKASESSITVIEGDSEGEVCRNSYSISAKEIVGYGDTEHLMLLAGMIEPEVSVDEKNTPVADVPECLCGADADGLHAETCPSYAETEVEETVCEAGAGEEIRMQVPFVEGAQYQWQRSLCETEDWQNIQDDSIASGWDTNTLTVLVNEESVQYQYRCTMKYAEETSEGGLLLALFSLGTAYAEEEEWVVVPQVFRIMQLSEGETTDANINITGYANTDLIIYNYLYYNNSDNNAYISTAGQAINITGNANTGVDILAGAQDSATDVCAPMAENIKIKLAGAQNDVIITPVYPDNYNYAVNMTISAQASMETLKLADNAKLNLTLNASLTITEVELGNGAELTIDTNGFALTVTSISGSSGTVSLKGSGSVSVSGSIHAQVLNLSNVTVNGNADATVTAVEKINLEAATVKNVSLLGFNNAEGENGVLCFTGNANKLESVATVGAGSNCNAIVTMQGAPGTTGGTVEFVLDYTVSYQETVSVKDQNTVIEPHVDWIVSYRAKYSGSSTEIVGVRQKTDQGMKFIQEMPENGYALPIYARDGYTFAGWKMNGSTDTLTIFPAVHQNIVFIAELVPFDVSFITDLGYNPTEYSNDKNAETNKLPERTATTETKFGESVELAKPAVRFGYEFVNWAVVNPAATGETDKYIHLDAAAEAYDIIKIEHIKTESGEDGEAFSVNLEAIWKKKNYVLNLFAGNTLDEDLLISTKANPAAEADWQTVTEFLNKYSAAFTKLSDNKTIAVNAEYGIEFGESIGDWFSRIGEKLANDSSWVLPTLQLKTDDTKNFSGWKTSTGMYVTSAHVMSNEGDFCLLDISTLAGNTENNVNSLEEYQAHLSSTPLQLNAEFIEGYKLILEDESVPAGWRIFYKSLTGETKEAVYSSVVREVVVPVGATIYLRQYTDAADYSRGITPWGFRSTTGFDLEVTENGVKTDENNETYMEYAFALPNSNVWMDYSAPYTGYIDLAKSPITFEEGVEHNNTSRNGFWYKEKLGVLTPIYQDATKGYFYTWDNAQDFYVTTKNVGTTNQLILINKINVHLKECILNQNSALQGANIDSTYKNATDPAKYGNIVLKLSKQYTVNLKIHGENTIGAIFQDKVSEVIDNRVTLIITGQDNAELYLGGIWGNYILEFNDITVNELLGSASEYLYYLYNVKENEVRFSNCLVNAESKKGSAINTYNTTVFKNNTVAKLAYVYGGEGIEVRSGSKVHILGDVACNYKPMIVSGKDSLLVVDGNVIASWVHASAGADISGGTVVVNGQVFYANFLKLSGGKVFANALSLSKSSTMSGGIIVANQIINSPKKISSYTTQVGKIDQYPYATHAQNDKTEGTYEFKGGSIYLMGMSCENADNASYMSADNPMYEFLVAASKGDTIDYNSVLSKVRSVASSGKECFVLGHSAWDNDVDATITDGRIRNFKFSGATVYAAGNITLFNDTTVSNGTINCYGGGMLTSKNDLTITGGTINAEGVGNACNITIEKDGLLRYAKTTVSGGSLDVNKIGAVGPVIKDIAPCGVVEIVDDGSPATIPANTPVISMLYANYVGDADIYDMPEIPNEVPRALVFKGTVNNSALGLEMNSDVTYPLFLTKETEPQQAAWKFGSVDSEQEVTSVSKEGFINGDNSDGASPIYAVLDQFTLYAVRNNYNLVVNGSYNGGFTVKDTGKNANYPDESIVTQDIKKNGNLSVRNGNKIEITFDVGQEELYNKTVVWYMDAASGVPVNVLALEGSSRDDGTKTITFVMPKLDVEILITSSIELDLYKYPIAFLKDGFAVELINVVATGSNKMPTDESHNATKEFVYYGDITVIQSNYDIDEGETTNTFIFEEDEIDGFNRDITLYKVRQKKSTDTKGNQVADNVNANLIVDGTGGKITIIRLRVPESASIHIKGKAANRSDELLVSVSDDDKRSYAIGNGYGKAGNIILQDLILEKTTDATLGYSYTKTDNVFKLINCSYEDLDKHSSSYLARGMNVELDSSYVRIYVRGGWGGQIFSSVGSLKICNGANLIYEHGCASHDTYPLFGAVCTVEVSGAASKLTLYWRDYDGNGGSEAYSLLAYSALASTVKVSNGATINAYDRLMLKNLVIDGGTVNVQKSNDSDAGSLLCEDITVNSGTLIADNIILSGFSKKEDKSKADVLATLQQGSAGNFVTSGSITINGGSVTANQFIGGSLKSTINVNGGTLNGLNIGSSGLLYGYGQNVPETDKQSVFTASVFAGAMPAENIGAVVNVLGGTVNVNENGYIGGVSSEVNVTGGLVQLAQNSVMGLNAAQLGVYETYKSGKAKPCNIALNGGKVEHTGDCAVGVKESTNGSIEAPYGSVIIQGETTGVHVHNLTADYLVTISISGEGYYDCPYNTGVKLNVRVDNLLQAGSSLTIAGGTKIYAYDALVNPGSGETGIFTIKDQGTLVYIGGSYGRAPEALGVTQINIQPGSVVGGSSLKPIVYVLNTHLCNYNDGFELVNNNVNIYQYSENSTETISLVDPTWKGRNFLGWYSDAALTQKVTSIACNDSDGYTLYAKWEYVKVPFSVKVPKSVVEGKGANYGSEISGIAGYRAADGFTYSKTVDIPYTSSILTVLKPEVNFTLKSYSVSAVKYLESSIASQTVDFFGPDLYQLYLDKNTLTELGTVQKKTIELVAESLGQRMYHLALDLNLQDGKPVDAKFPNGTADSITGDAYSGYALSSVANFNNDGKLLEPTATGYDFLGWYTTPVWTNESGKVDANTAVTADTTYYAHWKAKSYLVKFDAGDDNIATEGSVAPAASSGDSTLYGIIEYDAPLTSIQYVSGSENAWIAGNKASALPRGWKAGQVFVSWYAGDRVLTDATLFNTTDLGSALNAAYFATQSGNTWTAAVAAEFDAAYAQQTVIFHANEGRFKSDGKYAAETLTQNPSTGEAFPGYTQNSEVGFAIVSTTAEAFASSKNYVENDYRNAIMRPGYTFTGWYKAGDSNTAYSTLETYPTELTLNLYAGWSANTYTVRLNTPDMGGVNSNYSTFNPESKAQEASVTVGQSTGRESWPSREDENAWYCYNTGNDSANVAHRLLLGFTFDALDPGSSDSTNKNGYEQYKKYAKHIKHAANSGCLFSKEGTAFKIPWGEYTISVVPDYPNGSSFDLYAVYRERSLVFHERYYLNNAAYTKMMYSVPWNQYSDYPYSETGYKADKDGSYEYLVQEGYSLDGWQVENTEVSYPTTENAFDTFITRYSGSADINVYTVYSANVVRTVDLHSSSEHKTNILTTGCEIPKSMRAGTIQYSLNSVDGLNLVSETEMNSLRYDQSKANNTVAITMLLTNPAGRVYTIPLDETAGTVSLSELGAVSSEWKMQLVMTYSSVISSTVNETLQLKIKYPDISNQSLTLNLDIMLVPTVYDVYFTASLPAGNEDYNVTNSAGWTQTTDGRSYTKGPVSVAFGGALPNVLEPTVEGCYLLPWIYNGTWIYKGTFKPPVTAANNGVVYLMTDYAHSSFTLSADANTRSQVTVSYNGSQMTLKTDSASVLYRSEVQIWGDPAKLFIKVGNAEKTVADWIASGGAITVTKTASYYSFAMPAMSVQITAFASSTGNTGTVTAFEPLAGEAAGKTANDRIATLDFSAAKLDGQAVSLAGAVAGKQLYLHSVTASAGVQLVPMSTMMETYKATAGTTAANRDFAFSVMLDSNTAQDACTANPTTAYESLGTITASSELSFILDNAYALVGADNVGTFTFTFYSAASNADIALNKFDTISIVVTVKRLPAQINVTVPLKLVLTSNIDGGRVEVDGNSYHLDNESSMRLQMTGVEVNKVENGPMTLKGMAVQSARTQPGFDASERNKFIVGVKYDYDSATLNANADTVSADGTKTIDSEGDEYNPLSYIVTTPLTFATHGSTIDNLNTGVKVATITHKFKMPE